MSRLDFLKQQAPENYVAGLGRGATGFTTRSDLGPAREGPSTEQIQEALAKRAAALGAAPPTAYGATGKKQEPEEEDDGRFQDPENETGLFAHGMYDREDDEADRIYQDVDEKMERRRRQRRLVHPFPYSHTPFSKNQSVYQSFLIEQITDVCLLRYVGKYERNKNKKSTTKTTLKSLLNLQTSNDPSRPCPKTIGQTYLILVI